MRFIIFTVACSITLLQSLVVGSPVPQYFEKHAFTRRDLTPQQVKNELGPQLTKGSLIFGPSDAGWANATERWDLWAKPKIQVAVQPAQEKDVATIVKYCNKNNVDFYTKSRGHSLTIGPSSLNGVLINMASLVGISVATDKKSGWLQGGVYGDIVISKLWDQGLVATTGSCTCVSLMGPALGGGHGRWQGFYGLVSDNFLNLNVVLANGSAITVNETSYPDLWWGMKGAGHNFGIVTSVQMKLYPRGPATWHYHNYYWTQDKLETVFTELNRFYNNGSTPVAMAASWGNFLLNKTISATEPIIWWTFAYAGSAKDAEALLAPFNKIKAAYEEIGDVPYPGVALAQKSNLGGPLCTPGSTYIMSTANLQVFNVTTERQIYNTFLKWQAKYPEFASATVLQEGYSDAAVYKNFNSADSAFGQRDQHLLTQFSVTIDKNPSLEPQARQWANEVLDLWNAGQPKRTPTTYVNYANGLESVESIYGPEPWRVQRLLKLKAKYDPQNKFRFYNPLVRQY